jgi:ElaA protein
VSSSNVNLDQLSWRYCHFDKLRVDELYRILALRQAVFVLEQHCLYQDADYLDLQCGHLCGWLGNELALYVRLVPPGLSYKECSIGRVLSAPIVRGRGLGPLLMSKAIAQAHAEFSPEGTSTCPIRIGAQAHLERFYSGLGFVRTSETYMEDGIPHIKMLRAAIAAPKF